MVLANASFAALRHYFYCHEDYQSEMSTEQAIKTWLLKICAPPALPLGLG
jgi:hypothetical protein